MRCYYWDDNEQDLKAFAEYARSDWDDLNVGVSLEVQTESDPMKAIEHLREHAGEYDLLMTDIVKGKTDELIGMMVMRTALHRNPKIGVIALSREAKRVKGESHVILRDEALRGGAHEFIDKVAFASSGEGHFFVNAFRASMRDKLEKLQSFLNAQFVFDEENEAALAAVVAQVGRRRIAQFVHLKTGVPYLALKPAFVRSGLSGAIVIAIGCAEKQGRDTERTILLKLSKYADGLAGEIEKWEEVERQFQPRLFAPFGNEKKVMSFEGWHALGVPFHPGTMTLIDWLNRQKRTKGEIATVLGTIMLSNGLKPTYARPSGVNARMNRALWELLGLDRRARIQLAIRELRGVLGRHVRRGAAAKSRYSIERLTAFVGPGAAVGSRNKDDFPREFSSVWSHGDLHGDNVLVYDDAVAQLIDPANIAQLPWPCDYARLTIDIFLRTADIGPESYEWTAMERWLECGGCLLSDSGFAEAELARRNPNMSRCVTWLRNRLGDFHERSVPDENLWQIQLAFAVELLRASYRRFELTAPKRCLALLLASSALRMVEEGAPTP